MGKLDQREREREEEEHLLSFPSVACSMGFPMIHSIRSGSNAVLWINFLFSFWFFFLDMRRRFPKQIYLYVVLVTWSGQCDSFSVFYQTKSNYGILISHHHTMVWMVSPHSFDWKCKIINNFSLASVGRNHKYLAGRQQIDSSRFNWKCIEWFGIVFFFFACPKLKCAVEWATVCHKNW